MPMSKEDQVVAAVARVPSMDHQALLTTRENALRWGAVAEPLIDAIDERLTAFKAEGGMAPHRLEFARAMLRMVEASGSRQWLAARDIFNHAVTENADNPFVIWMKGNGARQIPITKALDDVIGEFPNVERMKDVQSLRVYFRVRA